MLSDRGPTAALRAGDLPLDDGAFVAVVVAAVVVCCSIAVCAFQRFCRRRRKPKASALVHQYVPPDPEALRRARVAANLARGRAHKRAARPGDDLIIAQYLHFVWEDRQARGGSLDATPEAAAAWRAAQYVSFCAEHGADDGADAAELGEAGPDLGNVAERMLRARVAAKLARARFHKNNPRPGDDLVIAQYLQLVWEEEVLAQEILAQARRKPGAQDFLGFSGGGATAEAAAAWRKAQYVSFLAQAEPDDDAPAAAPAAVAGEEVRPPRLPPVRLSTGVRAAVGRTRAKELGAHLPAHASRLVLVRGTRRRADRAIRVEPDAAEARYLRAANAGVTALLDSFPVGPRAASALLYPGRPGWEPSNADRDAINRLSSNRQQAVALAARARERQRERSLRLSRGDDGAASDGDDGPLDPVTRSLVTGSCSGLPSLFDARRSGRLSGRRGSGGESEEEAAELPKTAEEWLVAIMAPPTAIRRPSFERKIASRRVGRARQESEARRRASGLPPLELSTAAANARAYDGMGITRTMSLSSLSPGPDVRAPPPSELGSPASPPSASKDSYWAARRATARAASNGGSAAASPSKASEAKLDPLTKALHTASMLGLPPPPPMSPKAYASEHSSLRSASFTPADRLDRARRDGAARRASFAAAQSPDDPVRKAVERHASSGSLRASASEPWLPSGSPARSIPAFSPSLAAEGRDILATIPSGSPPSAPSPAHAALRPASPNRRRLKLPSRRRKLKFGGKAAAKNGAVSSDDDDESLPSTSLDDTFEDDSRSSMRI